MSAADQPLQFQHRFAQRGSDAFWSRPSGERADQARLLKAEAFYKTQNFTEAASIYTELRASRLSLSCARRRINLDGVVCRRKMGPARSKPSAILQAFPDNAQVQRHSLNAPLLIRRQKLRRCVGDLNLLRNARKRAKAEAFQQKALILGQQDNAKEWRAFQQLLKEYPKSAVAAQANYYIGKPF